MKRRPEPDDGRVELDRGGVAWQRHDQADSAARWHSTMTVTGLAWLTLQARYGPTEPMEAVVNAQ